jgi:hypothetical protein
MDPVIEDRQQRIQAHARYPEIKEWFERYLDLPTYYTQERCFMFCAIWDALRAEEILSEYAYKYRKPE